MRRIAETAKRPGIERSRAAFSTCMLFCLAGFGRRGGKGRVCQGTLRLSEGVPAASCQHRRRRGPGLCSRFQGLSPLEQHDRARGGELLPILRAYLVFGGNITETAKARFLHRNTALYHLKKIGERIGLDLDDPEDLFRIRLALGLRDLA